MSRSRFKVKRLSDGRAALNLACGTKMHWQWNNIDYSPYARLAHYRFIFPALRKFHLLSELRVQRLGQIDPEMIAWDLRKGIPFDDDVFDIVYHSHFLEHIDREYAPGFLAECYRVLKPNGIIRIVVPDMEQLAREYLRALDQLAMCGCTTEVVKQQTVAMEQIFDQFVRREITGSKEQKPIIRWLERRLRGTAADAGELHRWMYDRYSLTHLLQAAKFSNAQVYDAFTSGIVGWDSFNLDKNDGGEEYKRGSLYVEAMK